MCCHGVGCGQRPAPLPPMSGISSPESGNNATQRRNPLADEVRDVMEGRRANRMKKAAPDPGLMERVRGIIDDVVNQVKKTMPAAPTERPGVIPR